MTTDLEQAVNLLQQKEPYQLVRQCELRKGKPEISAAAQFIRQPKRPTDEENKVAFSCKGEMVDLCGKFL